MLRYLTAGESHGECLVAILEGMPFGVKVNLEVISNELTRRREGYGRSQRMKLEFDKIEILSGIRSGLTMGSPIALRIINKEFKIDSLPEITQPRPGHGDLAGAIKYQSGIRNILERASARETAIRVAIGAFCKSLLIEFGVDILSHLIMLGGVSAKTERLSFDKIRMNASKSILNCADNTAEKPMIAKIDEAKKEGDTVGGVFEIIVINLPVGLGSHVQWDRRLDGRLAQALISIPAIKGVEFGLGFESARKMGSEVHDEIFYNFKKGFFRKTNRSGGLEAGITNGEPLVMRCVMKPISTLMKPLASVDILSKKQVQAAVERADVCAVPSAGVIGEAVVAIEIAQAMLEKFGGDSLSEMKRNYEGYMKQVKSF